MDSKFLSGRFILTIVGALCFLIIVLTIAILLIIKHEFITIKDLESTLSTVLIILSNIFTFYFIRKSMEGNKTSG